jgi:hypothetical protein
LLQTVEWQTTDKKIVELGISKVAITKIAGYEYRETYFYREIKNGPELRLQARDYNF